LRREVRSAVSIQVLFVLFGVVVASFFPFFALFLKDRGLDERQIGLVVSVMAFARVMLNPGMGHLADTRLGRRRMLQVGVLAGGTMALAVFLFGHGLLAIVVLAAVFAGVGSAAGPSIDALALDHLGDERMADYGRIRGWESLSYAVTCLALGGLLEVFGIRYALVFYACASLLVLLWNTTIEADLPKRTQHEGRLGAVGAVFREAPRFWMYLAGMIFVWVGFTAAWNFISLKIERGGGGPFLVGVGTALGGAVEVPVMRWSTRLQRTIGIRRTYVLGCLIYATGFLLWGLISNPTIVSMLTVFEGFGFALLFTSGVVIVGKMVPSSLYATGQSIASTMGFGVAPIVGGVLGGYVYETFGPVTMYVMASGLVVVGAALSWITLSTPEFGRPGVGEPGTPVSPPEPGIVP
jgi:MFS transporter, PPP family, 3-phenylpropionic acid transporter